MLLFMIPADTNRSIQEEYNILLNELQEYNPDLLDKPRMLAISKYDLIDDGLEQMLRETLPEGIPTIFISAVTNKNLQQLKDMLWKQLVSRFIVKNACFAQTVSTDGGRPGGRGSRWSSIRPRGNAPACQPSPGLPTASWVMTYEVCGAFPRCRIHPPLRRRARLGHGEHTGRAGPRHRRRLPRPHPRDHLDAGRRHPGHPDPVDTSLFDADHGVTPGNGSTLFVNRQGGTGRWTTMNAPVAVIDPSDNFCPNYSSPVLDLDGSGHLLELASFWDGPVCRTTFGTSHADLSPRPRRRRRRSRPPPP